MGFDPRKVFYWPMQFFSHHHVVEDMERRVIEIDLIYNLKGKDYIVLDAFNGIYSL